MDCPSMRTNRGRRRMTKSSIGMRNQRPRRRTDHPKKIETEKKRKNYGGARKETDEKNIAAPPLIEGPKSVTAVGDTRVPR
jgi:hypothetical protein